MGWQAECIIVNEREPGYLGTYPEHSPERAKELIKQLDWDEYDSLQTIDFEQGINPDSKYFSLGAYDGAFILGDCKLCGSVEHPEKTGISKILKAFSHASILILELHSVINHFGYAIYEKGALQRAYGGDADIHVRIDNGSIQPEEKPYFDKSVMQNGNRLFVSEIAGKEEKFDASAFGEELVFAVSARFFGDRLDSSSFDLNQLPMELFQKKKTAKNFWEKLWSPK